MKEFAQVDVEYEEEIPVVSDAKVVEEVENIPVLPVVEVEEVIPDEVEYVMPLAGELQKSFSTDELLWDDTMKDWRTHNGIDIASDVGTEVDTAAAGIVIEAFESETYGFVVKVQHPDGIVTVYKNLERIVVEKDDAIDLGQMIGTVGNKASFEIGQKPHLHFEVIKDEKNINPMELIK